MASERVARLIRMPKALNEALAERASQEDRSANAEIVRRLLKSIEEEDQRRK